MNEGDTLSYQLFAFCIYVIDRDREGNARTGQGLRSQTETSSDRRRRALRRFCDRGSRIRPRSRDAVCTSLAIFANRRLEAKSDRDAGYTEKGVRAYR